MLEGKHLEKDNWVLSSLDLLLDIRVFPKRNGNSMYPANSGNLINQWSINYVQLKDPVSHLCLVGTEVASKSLILETAGSNSFNDKYFLSLNSGNSVKTFSKNSTEKDCLVKCVDIFDSSLIWSSLLVGHQSWDENGHEAIPKPIFH